MPCIENLTNFQLSICPCLKTDKPTWLTIRKPNSAGQDQKEQSDLGLHCINMSVPRPSTFMITVKILNIGTYMSEQTV